MNFLKFLFLIFYLQFINCADYHIENEDELHAAFDIVLPGDSITMFRNDESHLTISSLFFITRSGTEDAPIIFNGHPNITFVSVYKTEFAMHLYGKYWEFNNVNFGGDPDTDGFFLDGDHIKVTGMTFKDLNYGMWIWGENNVVTDLSFTDVNRLIYVAGDTNMIDGGQAIRFNYGISMQHCSEENTLQNFVLGERRLETVPSYYLRIEGVRCEVGKNIIRKNKFIIPPGNHTEFVDDLFLISQDKDGIFEDNIIDFSNNFAPNVLFRASWMENYTIRNNRINYEERPKNVKVFFLENNATSTNFQGNRMTFPEGDDSTAPFCIFGDVGSHLDNTEIMDDNICENGRMTNIFE